MGKILFCNNNQWNKTLNTIFETNGFRQSYNGSNIIAYYKKRVNERNFIEKDGNFIVITGSYAYDDTSDISPLDIIYKDLIEEDRGLKYVRNKLIGTYCIAYKKDDKIYIATDETHTYAMYYYIGKDGVVVTNTYYHIARVALRRANYDNIAVYFAKGGFNSNNTPIDKVFRLMEDEFIEYNLKDKTCKVLSCELNTCTYKFSNKSEAIDALCKEISHSFLLLNKNKRNKLSFVSGGLDSRVRLAIDLHYSQNVQLGYWKGGDSITNYTCEDEKTNRIIADKEGLKTQTFDVNKPFCECLKDLNISECDKYGEYASIYSHNSKWFNLFESLTNVEEIEFGTDSDVIRELSYIDKSFYDGYDLNTFIENASLRNGFFKRIFQRNDINKLIEKEITDNKLFVKKKNISKSQASFMFNYSRLDMANEKINLINQYFYSVPLLHTKKCWDIIMNIPYEWKANSRLSIAIIEYFHQQLLDIPVYTQRRYAKYSRKGHKLKVNAGYAFLRRIQPYLINTKLYSILYTSFLQPILSKHTAGNNKLLSECISHLKESVTIKNCKLSLMGGGGVEPKGFDIAGLCVLLSKCKTYDILYNEKG